MRDDRVDHPLKIGVGPRHDPAEQVALAGDGVHLQHLRDLRQVRHHAIPPGALRDLQRHERRHDEAERARVDVRTEAGDHAAGLQPVQPGLGGAAGDAEPAGALQHPDPGLLGQQGDEPRIERIELSILSSGRAIHAC